MYAVVRNIGATALCGTVSSNFGHHCVCSPPMFAAGCHFFAGHRVKLAVLAQTSLLKLRREGRTVGRGMAETWMDQ